MDDFLDDSFKARLQFAPPHFKKWKDWGQKWIDGRMIEQLGLILKPLCSTQANPQETELEHILTTDGMLWIYFWVGQSMF